MASVAVKKSIKREIHASKNFGSVFLLVNLRKNIRYGTFTTGTAVDLEKFFSVK